MTHPESDRRRFLKMAGTGAVGAGIGSSALVARRASAQDMRTLVVAGDSDIDTLDPHSFKSIGAYLTQVNIYDSPLTWKVQPVQGKPGAFILLLDRWNPKQLGESRYVWLPFRVGADGTVRVVWRDRWDLSVFDKELK